MSIYEEQIQQEQGHNNNIIQSSQNLNIFSCYPRLQQVRRADEVSAVIW